MTSFFVFSGRLGRLAFLLRGMALGLTSGVLLVIGFALFLQGRLWWLGLLIAVITIAALVFGYASLVARRLHDINLSGYHAIWIAPFQLFGPFIPSALIGGRAETAGFDGAIFAAIAVVGAALLLWPGTKKENRFDEGLHRSGWRVSGAFRD